ncbi:MAG: MYXO-CTERM domain-containing protein [Kiritimatiellia bacterium]|jgi:MYXO-CTERM domain-containing protein
MRSLFILALAGFSSTALAQQVKYFDPDGDGSSNPMIATADIPEWSERGTGSAAVVYDAGNDQYVMYFEAKIPETYIVDNLGGFETYGACATSKPKLVVWAIGRATSKDGKTGWIVDPSPVLMPVPNTFYGCTAAQPDVVIADGVWHMYFKASDGPPTDPDSLRGVGHAISRDGVSWTIESDAPAVSVSKFGFPKVMHFEEPGDDTEPTWHMWLTTDQPGGDLIGATALAPGGPWTLDTAPQINNSSTPFDYLFNPAPVCAPSDPESAIKLIIGGGYNAQSDVGLTRFHLGPDFRWSPDAPFLSRSTADELKHWDAVALDDGSYLVYYTRKQTTNQIYLLQVAQNEADLDFEWNPSEWRNGQCLLGWDPDPCEDGVSDECCDDQPELEGCVCHTAPGSDECCDIDPESSGCACVLEPGSLACCAEDPTSEGCICLTDPGSEACCDENPEYALCEPEVDSTCNCETTSTSGAMYPLLAGLFVIGFRRRRR